jgi:hypothetical protein
MWGNFWATWGRTVAGSARKSEKCLYQYQTGYTSCLQEEITPILHNNNPSGGRKSTTVTEIMSWYKPKSIYRVEQFWHLHFLLSACPSNRFCLDSQLFFVLTRTHHSVSVMHTNTTEISAYVKSSRKPVFCLSISIQLQTCFQIWVLYLICAVNSWW